MAGEGEWDSSEFDSSAGLWCITVRYRRELCRCAGCIGARSNELFSVYILFDNLIVFQVMLILV